MQPYKFDEFDHLFDVLKRPARAIELSNVHAMPIYYFCRRLTGKHLLRKKH